MKAKNTTAEGNMIAKIYFYSIGVGSLLAWNTVLTAVDYFQTKFPFANMPFLFPIPYFISNISCNSAMVQISEKFSLNCRVAGCFAIMCAILYFLPMNAALFSNYFGFFLLMLCLFALGGINIIAEASSTGFAALFPPESMNKFLVGTGMAGLTVNFLRIICLLTIGDESSDVTSIIMYFTVASAVTIVCIVVHLKFVKTDFCKAHMQKATYYELEDLSSQTPLSPDSDFIRNNVRNSLIQQEEKSEDTKRASIPLVFKEIYKYPILVLVIYIQTFMMFPGVTLKKHITGLNSAWNTVIFIMTFNFFDIVGKGTGTAGGFWGKHTQWVVLSRFLLFVPFILMASGETGTFIDSDWYAIVNQALFGFSNGFCTALSFTMAATQVDSQKKETTGFIMQLFLYIGILLGTFLALPFRDLGS